MEPQDCGQEFWKPFVVGIAERNETRLRLKPASVPGSALACVLLPYNAEPRIGESACYLRACIRRTVIDDKHLKVLNLLR
ncbi:MAG TPA: hypothetical protein VF094_06165 [Gaiellaceae bacterium]